MKKLFILFLLVLGFSQLAVAQSISESFYIQQRSTNRLAVPYYGKLQKQNTILMHPDPATPKEKGHFFFEQKDGPWGLIVSAYDNSLCLCPYASAGWRVLDLIDQSKYKKHDFVESNPQTGTFIGYSNRKTELCYWRIDQENDEIIHKSSGTYMVAQGSSGEQYPSLVAEKDKNKFGKLARKFVIIKTDNVQNGVKGEELKLNSDALGGHTFTAAGMTWIDVPTGVITKIQVMKQGGSITTVIGESVGVNLLSEEQKIQSQRTSTALNSELEMSASGQVVPFGPKVESKFKLGLSLTQEQEITNKVRNQTSSTLKESRDWSITAACPPTQKGHVVFAISEQIIRVRKDPMSITVPGKDPVYIQESVPYTKVIFTDEYAIGSPEIKRKWNEYKRIAPQLLSRIEEAEYINPQK